MVNPEDRFRRPFDLINRSKAIGLVDVSGDLQALRSHFRFANSHE